MRMVGGLPVVVGVAAAALAVVVTAPRGGPDEPDGVAVPDQLAPYSHLTGSVSASPPGPAVALYQHGYGVELWDFPQAVVLGAGGDVYRRVDVAEDRAGAETQGDPAPMLLSPDGRFVAVGDHDTESPDVAVVDLSTGESTRHPLVSGRSVVPLAWSSDGGTMALLLSDEPTSPYSGGRITGDLGLLDLTDDTSELVTLDGPAAAAAFSPDGSRLAVEQSGRVSVVDLDGTDRQDLDVDGVLAGPSAWSPDGRLVAVTTVSGVGGTPGVDSPGTPTGLAFADPTRSGAPVPGPLPLAAVGAGRVLGWSGPQEVLYLLQVDDADAYALSAVPLDGGSPRTLMRIDDLGSYGVGRFQLAAATAAGLEVVSPADVDRGAWPLPLRLALAALVAVVAWWTTRLVVRRLRDSHARSA